MTDDRTIAIGKRIEEFLKDPDIQEALAGIDETYNREWREADTLALREYIWTKQRVLKDVLTQLKVVAGRGSMAQASLTAQARRATTP